MRGLVMTPFIACNGLTSVAVSLLLLLSLDLIQG